jgi:predicted nucleotidyltransferase
MIPEAINHEILQRLRNTEAEHGVRVLFAIESGSRAWGFASPNSDYDVRFIYAREPQWYQAIDLEERRDVIEYPIVDDIDINGWDVRKALRLFWKSNPALIEWLQSPITYLDRGLFRAGALELMPEVYSVENGIHHYRSMAKTNYREYLRRPVVRLKKYFYVLRPLLAARWIEKTGTPAPIEFAKLLPLLEEAPELLAEVHRLLELKRSAPELGLAPAVPLLNAFIEAELEAPREIPRTSREGEAIHRLNDLFHRALQERAALD